MSKIRHKLVGENSSVSLASDDTTPSVTDNGGVQSIPLEVNYRRLLEGISNDYVFYTHTPGGTVTYVSPSITNVLGYQVEDIIGRNWRELVGDKHLGRDQAERVRAEVEAGVTFHKFLVEIRHADGSTRIGEVHQKPFLDCNGNYVSMEGVARDLTDAVRNASELRRLKDNLGLIIAERTKELSVKNKLLFESEQRYRSIVEDQTEFVTRWLPGGELTFANGACCRFLEKPFEEIIGTSFLPMIYEEDLPKTEKHIEALTPENPLGTIEHRVYRPNGTIGWMEWTNRAIFDENGYVQEYQGAGRDVTALKIAAETIREKEIHLAHVSRLATMGEMVAGIAHEVHQPLHAAKTFAEAARRSLMANLPDAVETAIECTKEISEAINRTAKIIRRLRDFTTPRSIEYEKIDINDVVIEASKLISHETRSAQVKIDFDLCDGHSWICADRVQIEQACVNLYINAFEAMTNKPPHERKLLVRTEVGESEAAIVCKDSGCGIEQDKISRLFDAFFTTKEEGMGMGLSLCKTIAVAHGGDIRAQTNDGPGLTFTLTLPLHEGIQESPQEELTK